MNEYGEFTTTELKNYCDNLLLIKDKQISDLEMKNNQLEYKYKPIEIPRDLAEAIETYNKVFENNKNEIIIKIVKMTEQSVFNPSPAASTVFNHLKQKDGLLTIMMAVINGYTIKKEPKGILRESILDIIDSEDESEHQVSLIMELVDKFNESESQKNE